MINLAPFADFLAKQLPLRLTFREFFRLKYELGEYSSSLPSGVVPGKRWLRQHGVYDPHVKPKDRLWYMGEYGPAYINKIGTRGEEHEVCDIHWMRIEFVNEDGTVSDNQDPYTVKEMFA